MTKINLCLTFILIVLCGTLNAQIKSDDLLFTVEGDSVMASEFIRVYSKNLDLVQDERQKDIDEYLNLFINYKLKIKEAQALGFDEKPTYLREFNNYKKQLAKNYLTDHEVTDALVKEAYDRISYDVKASHILIRIPEHEKDTAEVYKRMLTLKDRLATEDFESVKAEVANGQDIIAEDLGYFSGFKMVYPFETVAFNTPIGEVSEPFRTRFGYHVLKVFDKRKSRGEVTVGHIMVLHNQKDSTINASQRIQEIYKMIKTPEDFESLAKQFSDDQSSAKKGGRLPKFKSGQLSSTAFEDVAFALTQKGQITKPFETQHGWHIVKLYEKIPLASFEEMKAELTQRVKRDARSQMISEAFISKLKQQYNVDSSVDLSYFVSILNDDYFNRKWEIPNELPQDKVLMNIEEKSLTYFHFAEYLKNAQKRIGNNKDFQSWVETQFEAFVNDRILKYHEENLEHVNEDYAYVLSEYRDGLLLFDLMEEKVWNAVKEDTLALKSYFEANSSKYRWPKRIDAVIVSGSQKEHVEKAQELLKQNMDVEDLKAQINKNEQQHIIVTSGKFTKDHQALPSDFVFDEGVTSVFEHNNAYHVVLVRELLPERQKTFDEATGNVISDYQELYEENWVAELRKKYQVEVNTEVLNKIKNQLSN